MGYNKIELSPSTKVDYLIYLSRIPTAGEITAHEVWGYVPQWSDYDKAEIFAPFTSSLASSYISGLTSPLTGWAIYRQKVGESSLKKVAELSINDTELIDYNVGNQQEYIYFVFPVTETELGISMVSESIKTCWWDWSVTELLEISEGVYTAGDIFLFDYNLESSEHTQNLDQTIYRTYSQFPKSSVGRTNYKTIGFSSLLGSINASFQYEDTIELKNRWDSLVAKGNPVLLKDRKGNIYYGLLQSPSSRFVDNVGSQPTVITVSFTEIGSPEEFQIYSGIEV
jgi:hypothetical protein